MNKRIYFAPCGIGLGHASRCLIVARSLMQRGYSYYFSSYLDAVEYLEREGFHCERTRFIKYWTWPDGTVDPWRSMKRGAVRSMFTFLQQVKSEMKSMGKFNPDIVVSDTRLSSVVAAKLLGIPSISIINQPYIIAPGFVHHRIVDHLAHAFSLGLVSPIWAYSEKILIPDFPPPFTICNNNMQIPRFLNHKIVFVGPLLSQRPEMLPPRKVLREKMGFDDRPLIYLAISGPRSERHWFVTKLLKHIEAFNASYQFALSLGIRGGKTTPWKQGGATVFEWLPHRGEMLKACDLVIGRGNHTTIVEAMVYGKPMLLIPTPEHTEQIGNAQTATKLGVARIIDQRYMTKEALQEELSMLIDDSSYIAKAMYMASLASKLNAISTIQNIITEELSMH